jgi:hypothetical protein
MSLSSKYNQVYDALRSFAGNLKLQQMKNILVASEEYGPDEVNTFDANQIKHYFRELLFKSNFQDIRDILDKVDKMEHVYIYEGTMSEEDE